MSHKPDFIIIGFSRCGTTQLGQNLSKHPDIFCSKEENQLLKNEAETLAKFKEGKVNGEKSPAYILNKSNVAALAKKWPDVKIIICLRHPIQGLHSLFRLRAQNFRNGNSISQVDESKHGFTDVVLSDNEIQHFSPYNKLYSKYIIENIFPFFDRSQIHFIIQERMFENTQAEMGKVFNFLGVAPVKTEFLSEKHYNKKYRYDYIDYDNPKYPEAIRKLLYLYRPYNYELFEIVGEKIPEWDAFEEMYLRYSYPIEPLLVNVYGHRRSGSELLIKSLEQNFNVRCRKFHQDYENIRDIMREKKGIYIIRDPRDVLTSSYYWWRVSGESEQSGIAADFKNLSFEEYLRGELVLEQYTKIHNGVIAKWDIEAGLFSDPVQRWADHVKSFHDKNVLFVRYEDLTSDPEKTLTKIGNELDLQLIKKSITPVKKLVGFSPRKGVVGDHKTIMNSDIEKTFFEKAKDIMLKYNYR